MDEVQLTLRDQPTMQIFVEWGLRDEQLVFSAEHVRYDEEQQENVVLKTEVITPEEFSAWWATARMQGWSVHTHDEHTKNFLRIAAVGVGSLASAQVSEITRASKETFASTPAASKRET